MNKDDTLRQIEQELSNNSMFGDCHKIVNQTLEVYNFIVDILSEHYSSIQQFSNKLQRASAEQRYRVLGDPVIRDAMNAAIGHLKNRQNLPDTVQNLFVLAAPFLETDSNVSLLQSKMEKMEPLYSEPLSPWIWNVDNSKTNLEICFHDLFIRELGFGDPKPTLRAPDQYMIRALHKGANLLNELFPELSRSALYHVHTVAVIDVEPQFRSNDDLRSNLFESVSTNDLPNAIFVSPIPLRNSWHTAEVLFHEALHKKFADLILIRSILRTEYSAVSSRKVYVRWREDEWSVDRALAAFHVYVHLVLYFYAVQRSFERLTPRYGPLHGTTPVQAMYQALERSNYLGEELLKFGPEELGSDGLRFLDWLIKILYKIEQLTVSTNE